VTTYWSPDLSRAGQDSAPAILIRPARPATPTAGDLARTALYRCAVVLLALLVGFGLAAAYKAGQDRQCRALLAQHDLTAYDLHACPPLTSELAR
jgi:hypothetical protein